jgi:hypothetical protein
MNRRIRLWTEVDNEKIRNFAGKAPLKEIARQLNRSEAATAVQASKLRVSLKLGADIAQQATTTANRAPEPKSTPVELIVAPAAIERSFNIYRQFQHRDQSVLLQARKILTQHIFGMVDKGERNEQRLTVGGLARLKAVERDHEIKSAYDVPSKKRKQKSSV